MLKFMFLFALAAPSGVSAIRLTKKIFSVGGVESKITIGLQILWFISIFVFVLVAQPYVWQKYFESLFS